MAVYMSLTARRQLFGACLAITVAVTLSAFNRWEMTAEAWGYWFFARIFSETGTFMILDRSPLYALYLNLFTWLGYPTSVTVQYLVSGTFATVSIVALFRKYLGLWMAVFAGILWVPYLLQFAEPPVQALSLGAMCLAVLLRQGEARRSRMATSYALFGVAALLRPTCVIAIGIFAMWDLVKIFRKNRLGEFPIEVRLRRADWPVGVVLILLAWFVAMQSPHPWNNVWTATTKWAPGDGKSLADSAFIQNFNVAYILRKYGSFEGKDFYFTNREIFGDATTMASAIRANPGHVVKQIGENVIRLPSAILQITEFHALFSPLRKNQEGFLSLILWGVVYSGITAAILYGAFRATRDQSMLLFLIISILMTGVTALSYVKVRWMYSMIPVLLLSAYWYGETVSNWLASRVPNVLGKYEKNKNRPRYLSSASSFAVAMFLVLFSNGTSSWAGVLNTVVGDLRNNKLHVLEQNYLASMRASFNYWNPLIRDCKGVLTLESTFVAAFADIPIDRVYDIWGIPPFGHFNDSSYDGFSQNRIDCVLISDALAAELGGGSNIKIRYENHIRPYVEYLYEIGAKTYDVPRYGHLIKLTN